MCIFVVCVFVVSSALYCSQVIYVLYVRDFVMYTCLCLCSTYIYCGQEWVSVFSLVNVVKRGLISSNVIHTVTSHYFHSAGPPPHTLNPSCPLSPLSPLFSHFCAFYAILISTHFLHTSKIPSLLRVVTAS